MKFSKCFPRIEKVIDPAGSSSGLLTFVACFDRKLLTRTLNNMMAWTAIENQRLEGIEEIKLGGFFD